MELFIDSANIEAIKRLVSFYPIDGVTTNPTILSREKPESFFGILDEIHGLLGDNRKLFIQTTGKTVDAILEEAKILKERYGNSLVLKIPMSEIGLAAVPEVKKLGVSPAMTAVFSPTQAFLAAKAGCDYVAPFVNRLDNILADGPSVVSEILELFKNQKLETKVVAASFKTAQQIEKCSKAGVPAITISPDLYPFLSGHPMTELAVGNFDRDWAGMFGEQTIKDF